jgi:branched-chain amino acid aminotransferase/4-amino-4-deoxychorismate lyase
MPDQPLPGAPSEAVPLDDRGLLLGDGLFETILWSGEALVLGEAHAQRLLRGAALLDIPAPTAGAFIGCAEAAAGAVARVRAAIRVTLTAGSGGRGLERPGVLRPRLFATASPSARPAGPAAIAVSSIRRSPSSPLSRLKTLAYLDNVLARREAVAQGADEAVMLNSDGEVAGAAAANLFWVRGGILHTPPTEAGCLDGIMRAAVIAAAGDLGVEVRMPREAPEKVAGSDALFLTSSLIGVRPAFWVGQEAPAAHPLVERLAAAVASIS